MLHHGRRRPQGAAFLLGVAFGGVRWLNGYEGHPFKDARDTMMRVGAPATAAKHVRQLLCSKECGTAWAPHLRVRIESR